MAMFVSFSGNIRDSLLEQFFWIERPGCGGNLPFMYSARNACFQIFRCTETATEKSSFPGLHFFNEFCLIGIGSYPILYKCDNRTGFPSLHDTLHGSLIILWPVLRHSQPPEATQQGQTA